MREAVASLMGLSLIIALRCSALCIKPPTLSLGRPIITLVNDSGGEGGKNPLLSPDWMRAKLVKINVWRILEG